MPEHAPDRIDNKILKNKLSTKGSFISLVRHLSKCMNIQCHDPNDFLIMLEKNGEKERVKEIKTW